MSNPYSSQTISSYNTSPPPDDGSQTAANEITWAGIKAKLADPIKTYVDAIQTAVSVAFQALSTAALTDTANSFTATQTLSGAALNEAQGANIASASSIDLGDATGNYVKITGTTAITALGTVQAGTRRIVEFAGALTLTHNATSLILPGGANITTAAGDVATFVSEGSGNWRCVGYTKANGKAVVESVPTTPFTKSFTSSQQTITSAGALAIAHGLGVVPTLLEARLKCLTAQAGYSPGQEFPVPIGAYFDGTNNFGLTVAVDATNLSIRFGSATNVFIVTAFSTGAASQVTNSNFALILRAWA